MEFKDIGILPEDSPYYQEASRIFFEALEANINPPLLIAALLNLKKARNGDETLFMEDCAFLRNNSEMPMSMRKGAKSINVLQLGCCRLTKPNERVPSDRNLQILDLIKECLRFSNVRSYLLEASKTANADREFRANFRTLNSPLSASDIFCRVSELCFFPTLDNFCLADSLGCFLTPTASETFKRHNTPALCPCNCFSPLPRVQVPSALQGASVLDTVLIPAREKLPGSRIRTARTPVPMLVITPRRHSKDTLFPTSNAPLPGVNPDPHARHRTG